jgi:hypothetical protein
LGCLQTELAADAEPKNSTDLGLETSVAVFLEMVPKLGRPDIVWAAATKLQDCNITNYKILASVPLEDLIVILGADKEKLARAIHTEIADLESFDFDKLQQQFKTIKCTGTAFYFYFYFFILYFIFYIFARSNLVIQDYGRHWDLLWSWIR